MKNARRHRWLSVTALLVLSAAAATAFELARLPGGKEIRASLTGRYAGQRGERWLPLAAISPALRTAVLSWEDAAFYHHGGVEPRYVLHAALTDLRQRRYARGGSTITQQLAKNLFLSREKTLRRKFDDMVVAMRMEQVLTKDEILEVYLNTAEWGPGMYGVEAASRRYFGVSASRLDWAQSALLVSILQNPRSFDPCLAPLRSTFMRRARVLRAVERDGHINASERWGERPLQVQCRPVDEFNARR